MTFIEIEHKARELKAKIVFLSNIALTLIIALRICRVELLHDNCIDNAMTRALVE